MDHQTITEKNRPLVKKRVGSLSMREKISRYFQLYRLSWAVTLKNTWEYLKVVQRFYSNRTFARVDSALLLSYLWTNPFAISKEFLASQGAEDVYQYGETPLTTFAEIAAKAGIAKHDTYLELGAGRGRTCFWASIFLGCSVKGMELIPAFVSKAEKIVRRYNLPNIQFAQENFLTASFSGASVIYLYGSTLPDEEIAILAQKCAALPTGTKIITVSYSLNEYLPSNSFEIMHCFPAEYTWGSADVYVQYVR